MENQEAAKLLQATNLLNLVKEILKKAGINFNIVGILHAINCLKRKYF